MTMRPSSWLARASPKHSFWVAALKAGVPIIPVSLDYVNKIITIGKEFYPTGDLNADEPEIRRFFKGVVGKVAANS